MENCIPLLFFFQGSSKYLQHTKNSKQIHKNNKPHQLTIKSHKKNTYNTTHFHLPIPKRTIYLKKNHQESSEEGKQNSIAVLARNNRVFIYFFQRAHFFLAYHCVGVRRRRTSDAPASSHSHNWQFARNLIKYFILVSSGGELGVICHFVDVLNDNLTCATLPYLPTPSSSSSSSSLSLLPSPHHRFHYTNAKYLSHF